MSVTPARVAAIDIGTNSVLLLVVEGAHDNLMPVVERATITRLGQGVDKAGQLTESAVVRTLACLAEYRRELERAAVTRLDVVGTSALRDAAGGADFCDSAQRILGTRPRVVSGEEEARLTAEGALSGVEIDGPFLVFDVGGGSTELVWGTAETNGKRIDRQLSLNLGSVRLFERFLATDPPQEQELSEVRRCIREALRPVSAPPVGVTLVGVAGTVTTLAAISRGLANYDSSLIHGQRLSLSQIKELSARLSSLSLTERQDLPGLQPGRADVIVAGALLVLELTCWTGVSSLVVSDRGVRWGLARQLAHAL